MPSKKRHIKHLTRVCLIGVYLSFFLVQLNVHLGRTPAVSFLTGDFISQHSEKGIHSVTGKDSQKNSKTTGFRLNKRFHPSYLFIEPELLSDLVKYSFNIKISLLNETQPLTTFSFNAPSLRGPPAVV